MTIDPTSPGPVALAMRTIRKSRRMRASEVARAMGMATRSYEHLEGGTGRITYDRIVAFAEATNSDPIAILLAQASGSAEFALRCADNKLMTIMMIAMMELDDDLGDDIAFLNAQTLVGGFTRLARDFARHVRSRETFAEEWLKEGASRISPAPARGKMKPAKS